MECLHPELRMNIGCKACTIGVCEIRRHLFGTPAPAPEPNKVLPCPTCDGDKKIWSKGEGSDYIAGSVDTRGWHPCPDCKPVSQEPNKVKPLAQYLDEYIEHEDAATLFITVDYYSWQEFFEQAIEAYESTENVTIKIERV